MAGKYFEEFEVGATMKHSRGRTITEMDNVLFSALTLNPQPLHLNEEFSAKTQFGQRVVNGIFTLGLAVGMTVSDLTEETMVANLGYENIRHPQPVFHGDTLTVETEVLSKRESRSNPDQGIVRLRHIGRNQHGTVVIDFERIVLMRKRLATGSKPATAAEPVQFSRRSLLFMPGDSLRKITKATQLEVDSIIMDLEDAVAPNHKEEARRTVVEALQTLNFGRRERLIRLSQPPGKAGEIYLEDLQATIKTRPDGYLIPKVETPEQVRSVSHFLAEAEQRHGWPAESVRLLAMIETARGVLHAGQIVQAGSRLEAVIFGAEDLAADIGARRTLAGWEVFYARSAVVTAAAAYGLQAIDMIFADLNDLAGLEAECLVARQLGFAGKTAIHPRQVEVINRVFTPSPEEVAQARRLVQAFEAHQAAGAGVFQLDGRMVEIPIVRAAERVLARATGLGENNT